MRGFGEWTSHIFFATLRNMESEHLSLRELMDNALKNSPLTQNAAAAAAGITGPRWRQIVNGYETKGGQQILLNGPPETLARMARAVDVTPDQLRRAKRPDAAEELERLLAPTGLGNPESLDELQSARQRALAVLRRAQQEMNKAGSDVEVSMAKYNAAVRTMNEASADAERLAQLIADRVALDVETAEANLTADDYALAGQYGYPEEAPGAADQVRAGEENQDPDGAN